jgi:uncharacterized membrane protein YoaK (UPF0700 family)
MPPGAPWRWRHPARDLLVVLLTITTGCADAVCFLHLGRVFGSVITGNLVLLGISAGKGTAAIAESAGIALGGYAAGVAVAAPIAREHVRDHDARMPPARAIWPVRVTICLAGEFAVLAAFSAGWDGVAGKPGPVARMVLLAVVAAAMGMQSAAVRRLGQISTTYLTSTLTGVIAALATGRLPEGLARSLGVLVAMVAGAVASAVTVSTVPGLLPLVILAPLGLVIAGSRILRSRV